MYCRQSLLYRDLPSPRWTPDGADEEQSVPDWNAAMYDHLPEGNHNERGAQNSRLGEEAATGEYKSIPIVSTEHKPVDHTRATKEGAGNTGYVVIG